MPAESQVQVGVGEVEGYGEDHDPGEGTQGCEEDEPGAGLEQEDDDFAGLEEFCGEHARGACGGFLCTGFAGEPFGQAVGCGRGVAVFARGWFGGGGGHGVGFCVYQA